ncbi:glutamate--cysteine ligase [Nannocystis exedens]|uniref:Glutamate--cysteine ligase n=1 Tax=Nannocystis exedens TaxID=54 RepID=A0A1I2H8D5_9BACT|nr:glutamate-cysteine ligase family protein [Nannocystis exedens]PCC70040.1 glutamate-cysteine ligase [Nannocystis exedens]SFF26454.1 glutamate--cysteine ligase [Nannocystis exedens]
MSSTPETPASSTPLQPEDLTGFFRRAERPDRRSHKIGTEHEKFGVVVADGEYRPVEYEAHVLAVMQGFMARFGWKPGGERGNDGALISLERDGASITLEPGGQFELSGKPLADVHLTCQEFTQHQRELHAVSQELGIAWLGSGFHPFATREEIHWMPKPRYAVMRAYLPTRGQRGLDMMLRTCTVQANFDYASEQQAGLRFRLAMGVSALTTALFANSPYKEGEDRGFASLRSDNWTDVDAARCGLLPWAFEAPFSYQRYVDWALDVPMFFIRRQGRYIPLHVPFRQYMATGYVDPDGVRHAPTQGDWELHLSTLFPEIRLKPYLEVRGCDSVRQNILCALPALWKGLLYDDDAGEAAWELVSDLDFGERLTLWAECRQAGLASPRVRALCARLLTIARAGLDRADIRDHRGRTEAFFLDPLEALVAAGTSPADVARAQLGPRPGRDVAARRAFVRAFHFAGAGLEET